VPGGAMAGRAAAGGRAVAAACKAVLWLGHVCVHMVKGN
jgi:hypothetical protein